MPAMSLLLRVLLIVSLAFAPAVQAAPTRARVDSDPVPGGSYTTRPATAGAPHPGRSGPLTPEEREIARVAWRYFENNTQSSTGLVNSVDKFPSTTLWDIGSSIAAIVSAHQLGFIGSDEASGRLARMLETLARIELFRGLCPNKAYNSATAQRVTYNGEPGEIGCSALDVGRLLVWMRILEQRYPALQPAVRKAVNHWNVATMVRGGELYGTQVGADGQVAYLQEGRLGYEEYGAKAFRLWGYDTRKAAAAEPFGLVSIYGVRIPYDARDPKVLGAHNYVVTESYALDGIEFGWDEPGDTRSGPFEHTSGWIARAAERVYLAQQRRFERDGILTARTEHQLAGAPYFVYDTVFSDGVPWTTITDTGAAHPEFASVAIKGAFGLWALWQTPYTDKLFAYVRGANDPQRGFFEGLLEKDGSRIEAFTANNNGIILETLLYKVEGKLYRSEALPSPLPTPAVSGRRNRSPPAAAPVQDISPVAAQMPTQSAAALDDNWPPPAASPIIAGALTVPPTSANASHFGRTGPLTETERAMATAAWHYFARNTQNRTGLVDAGENYPSSTLWDTAAVFAAVVSAQQIGLIDRPEAETRLSAMLTSLAKIRRFRDQCPNKAFNTATLVPTNYSNQPKEIGCSALDLGRALIWLRIVHNLYPALRPATEALVDYWNIGMLVRDGTLVGSTLQHGDVIAQQEGRLGYEEYAAKGFALWGLQADVAAAPEPYATAEIEGVVVAHDTRDAHNRCGSNHVVTESYALDGIELGWDRADDRQSGPFTFTDGWIAANAWHVYLAQERRSARTGILTARSEHQLAAAPNFVYDTVFSDGVAWATVDARGRAVPTGAAVSAKAALGLWALWPSTYTNRLFDAVASAFDADRGFYEGTLEAGGRIAAFTANNNGIILESLLYKLKGPLIRLASE
jgi:hypothetical protein